MKGKLKMENNEIREDLNNFCQGDGLYASVEEMVIRENPKNFVFNYFPYDPIEEEEPVWVIGLRSFFEEGYMDDGWQRWPLTMGLMDITEGIYGISLEHPELTDEMVTNKLLALGVGYEPTCGVPDA